MVVLYRGMQIRIRGAYEHNLTGIDVRFGNCLTAVTGISGSGKTSLVFDTLYHEARRRFLDLFELGGSSLRFSPARVTCIEGLGPAVAVGQNLLNRNPYSTVATAAGLHPFLRLLYARYGERHCPDCQTPVAWQSGDEIAAAIKGAPRRADTVLSAVLAQAARGSHQTLLSCISRRFSRSAVLVDRQPWDGAELNPRALHDIWVRLLECTEDMQVSAVRQALEQAWSLGAFSVALSSAGVQRLLSRAPVCTGCGRWFSALEPHHFRSECPFCRGKGCGRCATSVGSIQRRQPPAGVARSSRSF